MKKYSSQLLILVFLNLFNFCYSQELSGTVLDGKTDKPIENAAVYFDNTTIGTITNKDGFFVLEYDEDIITKLVVSHLGYETQFFAFEEVEEGMKIYLFESEEILNEVVLDVNDGWSRRLKLREFKKHYLGESNNGKACRIVNEDAIILKYDKRRKQLTATSSEPLIIKNSNLKYEIVSDLKHFEANYSFVSKNKKRLNVDYVYYSGANFYKSMQSSPTKSVLDKRRETYEGSVLHFMRAMAQKRLKKNGYRIYLGNTSVSPGRYITVFPIEDSNNVNVRLKNRLNVLYKNGEQSSVESLIDQFHIDHFGNHSPPDQIRFAGAMGKQRMGDTLPLDFLAVENVKSK